MKKIVLIANYLPDKQESMERYVQILKKGFELNDVVKIIRPLIFFGKIIKMHHNGISKWLGYLDKYILFSIYLLIFRCIQFSQRNNEIVYHICDHSNSVYERFLPSKYTFITCHDVLAIRGAFGYKDAYCEATPMGQLLQKCILNSLFQAKHLIFVSQFTKRQYLGLLELYGKNSNNQKQVLNVLYNGFNAEFRHMLSKEADTILKRNDIYIQQPYLLHVGSSLPRKNRALLVKLIYELATQWNGMVVLAGQPIDLKLQQLIDGLGVAGKIISVIKPSHEVLVALYSNSHAFVFPSFSEGFGWPMIEAQVCGTPVITSNLEPMIEVCGGAALHLQLNNIASFVTAVINLDDKSYRTVLIDKGFYNVKRYTTKMMIDGYLDVYKFTDNA